jgi:hypothetical protein
MGTTYDMYISYFQVISISSLRWLKKTTFILYENYQTHVVGLYSIVGSFVLHLHVSDSTTQIQSLNHMVT